MPLEFNYVKYITWNTLTIVENAEHEFTHESYGVWAVEKR